MNDHHIHASANALIIDGDGDLRVNANEVCAHHAKDAHERRGETDLILRDLKRKIDSHLECLVRPKAAIVTDDIRETSAEYVCSGALQVRGALLREEPIDVRLRFHDPECRRIDALEEA